MNNQLSQPSPSPHKRLLIIGSFVFVVCGILIVNVLRSSAAPQPGDPNDAEQVQLGQQVYSEHCASCHGINLEGQPNWQQELPTGGWSAPPHDETGHTWHHNDQSLFATVKFGGQATSPPGYKSNMPSFGTTLADNEIWAALAYIKSTWSPEIQAAQQQGHQ